MRLGFPFLDLSRFGTRWPPWLRGFPSTSRPVADYSKWRERAIGRMLHLNDDVRVLAANWVTSHLEDMKLIANITAL